MEKLESPKHSEASFSLERNGRRELWGLGTRDEILAEFREFPASVRAAK